MLFMMIIHLTNILHLVEMLCIWNMLIHFSTWVEYWKIYIYFFMIPLNIHLADWSLCTWLRFIKTLRPRQNGRHFPYDIFKCIFLNENVSVSIKFSLKFVHNGSVNNIPVLVQIMAWRRPGDKPLSEPMMVSLLMHICVTRLQWVKPALS